MRTTLTLICTLLALSGLAAQEVYPFAHQGKWGVVDGNGQVTMPPALDSIGFFTSASDLKPTLAVANRGGKAGLITRTGTWILKPTAESISYDLLQTQPLRWAKVRGKYGLLDVGGKKAKWLTKPIFDEVDYFEQSSTPLVAVRQGSGWGVLNGAGQLIVPCTNEAVEIFPGSGQGAHIRITNKDQITRLAYDGTPLVEASEDELLFEEEMWGMAVEEAGHVAIVEYNTRLLEGNGRTEVLLERREAGMGWQVEQRTPVPEGCEVAHIERTSSHIYYILITRAGKFGFISTAGEITTEPIYDSISWIKHPKSYHLPVALLHLADRVGAANSGGQQVLPATFTQIRTWNDWFIVHTPNGYQGLATKTGQVLLPAGWEG